VRYQEENKELRQRIVDLQVQGGELQKALNEADEKLRLERKDKEEEIRQAMQKLRLERKEKEEERRRAEEYKQKCQEQNQQLQELLAKEQSQANEIQEAHDRTPQIPRVHTDQVAGRLNGPDLDHGRVTELDEGYLMQCTDNFAEFRRIGEGAHGVVYRAVDTSKGMWFAVKHLKFDGDEGAKLFQRELQALRRFRHPHIIRLLGICGHPTSGRMYLAFEYATHGSVEDWLKDDSLAKIWPFGRRMQTATGVAQALNYMYRALGQICLHRDVKSANIVLCQGMVPKLIDCGLSIVVPESVKTTFTMTSVAGTQGYMCPQYLRDQRYSEKSEVHSFGVVLCELISGLLAQQLDIKDLLKEDELEADARPGPWPDALVQGLLRLAKNCTRAVPDKRPQMLTVMRELMALQKEHVTVQSECDLQLKQNERLQEHLQTLRDEFARRVNQLEHTLAGVEHQRAEAERAMLAQEAAEARTCCVCYEDMKLKDGVDCPSGEAQHFLCTMCLESHLNALAEEGPTARNRGRLQCPMPGCVAPAYPDALLAQRLSSAVYQQYQGRIFHVREVELVAELNQQFNAELQRQVAQAQEQARQELEQRSQDAQVQRHHQYIREQILTLQCPRCGQAFFDFDGCFALTCGRCKAAFCAYCLRDCGHDAHQHVANCPDNLAPGRDVFGREDLFTAAQQQRRRRMVKKYLDTLDVDLRRQVLEYCQRDLRDIGVELRPWW
jgi:hypothetical protein